MSFSAQDVAKLREITGAGMMDCKKALTHVGGDMQKAADYLREQGVAIAAKKANRLASEGVVAAYTTSNGLVGAAVEVNSESDFVAKSDDFIDLANKIACHVANKNPSDTDTALSQKFCCDESITVQDLINQATAKIGEKLSFRRFSRFEISAGHIESYIHMGGKIGVLLQIKSEKEIADKAQISELGRDIAMHIAAFSPKYISEAEVPQEDIQHEKTILKAQIVNDPKAAGKPEAVVSKMIDGRISKYLKEICLVDQDFAKDPSKTVGLLLEEFSKKIGNKLKIEKFTRFVMGEGLEKKVDNLAEEVAKLQQ
ncbi:MAG: translation elongation factor Ts [Firmicutes bacterium]|nr:translation elongation factor Ts [Bacillota bacterium]